MKVQINNIEFSFYKQGSDHMKDEDNLGLAHLTIPGTMSDRFRKECGILAPGYEKARKMYTFPHYESDNMDNICVNSDHDCCNSDTQIVLMNWLFDKKRKYRLDYTGLDSFWLFHDSLHAESDVYSYEMNNIYSSTERQRLIEGAEFAYKNGVGITAETMAKLDANWNMRWRSREGSGVEPLKIFEFYQFTSKRQANLTESYMSCGTFNHT